jgi:putative MATE family efflux protein
MMSNKSDRSGLIDMTKGNPIPLIITFALPILLGNIFQQLYTVVDGIVVGKNVGDQAMAAVGVGFPITYMLTSIFIGLGVGSSVLVSQYFGQKNMKGIGDTITTMNTFLLLVSLPVTLLGIFTAGPFLKLLNVQADIFDIAKLYMVIYYIGLLPQFGYNVNSSIFQGMGDSKTPLIMLAASSILHIILAYAFVVILPWGVAGVAWSTVVSQYFSWFLSVWYIKRKHPEIGFRLLHMHMDKACFKETLRIGVPTGIQNALFSVGMMVMQPLINQHGTAYIAGYNAAVRVDGFVFMPVTALTSAITTYVGQNIGANDLARVKKGVSATMGIVMGLCLIMSAIVIPLRYQLMYLFTDNPEVVARGNAYLVRVIPLYFISTLQYMYIGMLRGAGESVVPTIATLISLWLARVPSAYLLSKYFGGDNMHWCYAIGWVMGLCILIPYYYSGRWKSRIHQAAM